MQYQHVLYCSLNGWGWCVEFLGPHSSEVYCGLTSITCQVFSQIGFKLQHF